MTGTPVPRRPDDLVGSIAGIAVVAVVAFLVLVAGFLTDRSIPTGEDWLSIGLLGALALVGAAIVRRFTPPEDESSPPWDVGTVWLMPAALLTPPLAFAPLVALSIALTLARRAHPMAVRVAVSSLTVLTVIEIHWAAQLVDNTLVAGLVSIIAVHLTGTLVALLVAYTFTGPQRAATWLDYRWSFVQLGCEVGGILTAVAMLYSTAAAIAALSPLLLAQFAFNWPQLDRHARIDPKTGLPNARHWQDRSEDLISAAHLHAVPVAVAMVDIDHFKAVNDGYGHLVGDDVLERFAATLRSQVTVGDVVGRFGGEEFAITFFGLDADAATSACDRIRRAVAALVHDPSGQSFRPRGIPAGGTPGDVSRGASSDLSADGSEIPSGPFSITCTIGVATDQTGSADLGRLLAAADEALAGGKAAGRNRVQQVAVVAARPGEPDDPGPDDPGPDDRGPGGTGRRAEASTSPWRVASVKRSWTDVAGQQRRTRLGRR